MRQILLSLLLFLCMATCRAQGYTPSPDSLPHDGVPKGTVTKFVLPPGKYYPGTPHNCAVYVPAEYDAAKPTPFMIFLDGSQAIDSSMHMPVVFDNLIAKHDLPPMIAIFIDPGVLSAVSDAAQNRYNRIYEYDSLTPRFAQFLLNELIPAVQKNYNLSQNPDDRGLSGVSTGAVGAFMAAWNRPDQFHRVLSLIGTYVSMKGADELPALIRKTEPKPIRIFMQDGSHDHISAAEPYGTHFSGSWPVANQTMYEALEFAGYDVKLEMGTGGHDLDQGGAILPDALRWLWRGYPTPIVEQEPTAAHEPGYDAADRVFSTIYVDKPWREIGSGYGEITSLTSDVEGNVYFDYFMDAKASAIERVDVDGKITQCAEPPSGGSTPHGAPILHMGPGDRLYAAISEVDLDNPDHGQIVSWSVASGTASDKRVVASGFDKMAPVSGFPMNMTDFAVLQNGTVYAAFNMDVVRIDPSGRMSSALQWASLVNEMGPASKIALSPDQSMVVVPDQLSRYGWSFQIAADGSFINGEPFYRLEVSEAIGTPPLTFVKGNAAEDTNGQVYFATPLGIQIAMQNGRISQILNSPIPGGGPLTAITFAGNANASWIYVAQDGKLFRRHVKVRGANAWTVVKPPKPTL
ncbi:MAG: alpha/beta hydrolase-fold protein [Terracidiphilus sp.]